MRFPRQLPIAIAAIGAVACTALLGDFNVGPAAGTTGGDGGGQAEAGVLTVAPGESKIGILRSQAFTATEDVTWSLQEGAAAGSIDASGNYFSGPTPGAYHVIATSKADPSRSVTVPIVVVNLSIGVLLGQNGGQGNIDGPAPKAHFNSPEGIAHYYNDGNGDRLYFVADTENHTIRMFDPKSGKVTTVAGKPGQAGVTDGVGDAARFTSPRQLAMDSSAKKLYVSDSNGTCVRVLDFTASYEVKTVTGTCGVSGSSDGIPGAIPTVATLSGVRDMALSGDRHSALYVCDGYNSLRRIDLVGPTTKGTAQPMVTAGIIGGCAPLAVDYWSGGYATKFVYFAENTTLKRFNEPAGWPITNVADIKPVAELPDAGAVDSLTIAAGWGGEDDVYASSRSKGVIYRLHGISGTPPLAFDSAPWAGVVNERRVADGNLQTARFAGPAQLDAFPQYGELFVADERGQAIRRIRPSSQAVDTFIGAAHVIGLADGPRQQARVTGPFSVATDDAGIVYFGDIHFDGLPLNSTIRKYDRAAAVAGTLTGLPTQPLNPATPPTDGPKEQARFWFPIDLTYTKGKLFVVDNFAQAIRRVDVATGAVDTIAGEKMVPGKSDGVGAAAHFTFVPGGSVSGGLGFFGGAITNDGSNLYVSDSSNFAIRKVVIATGETTTIAGGSQGNVNAVGKAAQFVFPTGIAYDSGNVYIADWQDHTIRRLNLSTGAVDGFIGLSGQAGDKDGDAATATLNFPFRLVADGLGNLYVAELPLSGSGQPSGVIRRIDIKNRRIAAFAGTPGQVGLQPGPIPSTLNCPMSLALTPQKDLVFGDFCEASIGIFQPL